MKQIFSILLTLLLLSGCHEALQPNNHKPTLQELQDVHYRVTKDGTLKLQKEYMHKDVETNSTKKVVITTDVVTPEKAYERVPLFDKGYKKHLSIKGQKKKTISIKGDKVKISVESIPVNEFIDLALGSVLKLNYSVSEDVKKMTAPVTLNMQHLQKASEVFKVVKKILAFNGIGIKSEQNILFVYKLNKKAKALFTSDIYIGYGRTLPKSLDDDREVMLFVPYNYISPGNTVNILRQIGINKVKFYYYIDGIQTMRGKAGEIRKALKFISLLDRPYLEGKTPYLIKLENIKVGKFLPKMKQIFMLNGINVVNTPSKGGIVMIPIEELNSLYIITPKREWLSMLLYWKNKLDQPSELSSEPQLYIYHVKNRKADELATAVNKVLGLSTQAKKDTQKKDTVAGEVKKKRTKSSKNSKSKNKSATTGTLFSNLTYVPTVTADLDTNILMLKLAPEHYKMLLPFIKELDHLPLQTLVEVTVAEVDMTDTFSLGFEYAIRNRDLGVNSLLNISGGGSGLGIVFNSNKIDATVNAFAEKKLLDIVSKPKLLILNNSTGNINVGTQVPIITSETSASDISSGTTPTINRNVTYRTTGIVLGLTPTINSNGILTMKININLSEAQTNDTSGIDSPLIVNRQLSTVAVIHSGDTILIGGLISHNKSRSKGGIPFLKDIPLIGGMFATQSHKITKTELIMLIHPLIIQTPQSLKSETNRFKTLLNYINLNDL